jgi:hypothetical protein
MPDRRLPNANSKLSKKEMERIRNCSWQQTQLSQDPSTRLSYLFQVSVLVTSCRARNHFANVSHWTKYSWLPSSGLGVYSARDLSQFVTRAAASGGGLFIPHAQNQVRNAYTCTVRWRVQSDSIKLFFKFVI